MGRWFAALVALVAACVYVPLCSPVSSMGDSSELTIVLATNGAAHPTGYPLYTLLGHGFCVLLHAAGVGWSLAAGLWSVVGAGVALFFLAALAMELVVRLPGAGPRLPLLAPLVPIALFAFQPVVLGEATRAEINIWSLAWACGATFAFVRLAAPDAEPGPARDPRAAAALWGLVCGLGLAHHLMSVLVMAPLTVGLILAFARRGRFSPALGGYAVAAALPPLASYATIVWRAWHPSAGQWPLLEPTAASVIRHVTGAGYGGYLGRFAPPSWARLQLGTDVFAFLVPGLAFLVLGALKAKDTDQRIAAWTLLAAALAVSLFTISYGVPDPAPYFLPAMALGVAAAAPAIASVPGAGSRAGTAAIAAAGLASLLLIVPWVREGVGRREATIHYDRMIRSMWSSIPADSAIVSWADDRFNRLVEYQVLRGEKPALFIVTPDLLAADPVRRKVRERFGADPLEGFEPVKVPAPVRPGTPEELAVKNEARRRLLRNLNDHIRAPVILFDPNVPIVWQLRKPWEPRR